MISEFLAGMPAGQENGPAFRAGMGERLALK